MVVSRVFPGVKDLLPTDHQRFPHLKRGKLRQWLGIAALTLTVAGCAANPPVRWPAPLAVGTRHAQPVSEQLRSGSTATALTKVSLTPAVPHASAHYQVSKIPPSGGQPERFNLSFNKMPLRDFVQYVLGQMLKLNLYIDPNAINATQQVNLRLSKPVTRTNLLAITRAILQSYGLALVQQGHLYRVLLDTKVAKLPPNFLRLRDSATTPDNLRPLFQYVPLTTANFGNIYNTLSALFGRRIFLSGLRRTNAILLYGQQPVVKSALRIIHLLDRPALRGAQGRLVQLVYLHAKDAAARLKQILLAEGYAVGSPSVLSVIPVPSSNSLILLSATQTLLAHAVAWVQKIDIPAQTNGNQGLFVYRVQHANATTLARIVSRFFSGENETAKKPLLGLGPQSPVSSVGAANGKAAVKNSKAQQSAVFGRNIVVNVATNSIIFRGSAEKFRQLRRLLQELDQPQRQILVQVTIAEITLGKTQQTGVAWALAQAKLGSSIIRGGTLGGLGVPTSSGLNFAVLNNSGATRALIEALATNNQARILSTPRIMVLNGAIANINIGNSVPVITSQQSANVAVNGTTGVLQTIQYLDTGIIMSVAPVILGQNLINMKIKVEVSNAAKTVTGVNSTPTIDKRLLETTLEAPNGDTIVLGGLISQNRNSSNTGVPVLQDIPWLGSLFRNHSQATTRTELLALITPYILSQPGQVEAITHALRKRFPGFRP